MASEQYANSAYSTLASTISAGATSLSVAAGHGARFPATGDFRIKIDSEIMICTARSTDVLTVTRGAESTTAASHTAGAAVNHVLTRGGLLALLTSVGLGTNGQIAFPATQNPSADANTLDDYEEGTWTPVVGGTATYTAQAGTYTKIGNRIHILGHLNVNVIGTGSPNTVSGFPFSDADATGSPMGISLWLSLAITPVYLVLIMITGSTTAQMYGATAASANLALSNALSSGADLYFGGTYRG